MFNKDVHVYIFTVFFKTVEPYVSIWGLGYLAQGCLGRTTRTPCFGQTGNRTPPFCISVKKHIWTNAIVYFTLLKQKQSHVIWLKVCVYVFVALMFSACYYVMKNKVVWAFNFEGATWWLSKMWLQRNFIINGTESMHGSIKRQSRVFEGEGS